MKEQHTDERTNEKIENMFYMSKKKSTPKLTILNLQQKLNYCSSDLLFPTAYTARPINQH